MSEDQASNTDAVEIYIPLLNEGTDVCRPTKGLPLGGMRFKVLPTADYSPEWEEWEFPPGSLVECKIEERDNRQLLVARSRQHGGDW
jgi:hypothetical protein